jgi:hypothetical protein
MSYARKNKTPLLQNGELHEEKECTHKSDTGVHIEPVVVANSFLYERFDSKQVLGCRFQSNHQSLTQELDCLSYARQL